MIDKIGEYRLIPKGTEFWSIKNQTIFSSKQDEIIQIKHTCHGNDIIYGEPKQLIGELLYPTLIGKGSDEWGLSYSKTELYQIPNPLIINIKYVK